MAFFKEIISAFHQLDFDSTHLVKSCEVADEFAKLLSE
jgi:hypothetical protein